MWGCVIGIGMCFTCAGCVTWYRYVFYMCVTHVGMCSMWGCVTGVAMCYTCGNVLQVWGCGGEAVLKEQTGQKQWEKKEADKLKNRKVGFIISSFLIL